MIKNNWFLLWSKLGRVGIRAKFFLLLYGIIGVSLTLVAFLGYQKSINAHRSRVKELIVNEANKSAQQITSFLAMVPNDLEYISNYYALNRYLYWTDIGVSQKANKWESVTTGSYRSLLNSRSYLYNIRFIDINGVEKIKIRYNNRDGSISRDSRKDLQSKLHREYYKKTINLKKGAIYVSPLELNMEYGKLEVPYVPVIRFAKPVRGDNDELYGITIVNVYAEEFLKLFHGKHREEEQVSHQFFLISNEGDYFHHEDSTKEWSKILVKPINFKSEFPEVFAAMLDKEEGTFSKNGHLVAFKRVHPSPIDRSYYWLVVGMASEGDIANQMTEFIALLALLMLILVFILNYASRYLIETKLTPLLSVTQQLELLGKGEFSDQVIGYRADDEIKSMITSVNLLTLNMQNLTTQVDIIASGDYSQNVRILSSKDTLGNAIFNMTSSLRQNHEDTKVQNWFKDGIQELSKMLTGDLTSQQLGQNSIEFLGNYTESAHGVFYSFKEESENPLSLLASYMFTARDVLQSQLNLGQGLVGQVARELKPILLTNHASSMGVIQTGTTSITPLNCFSFPLLYDGQLYGVLELSSTQNYNEITQEFFIEAANIIASTLYTVLQKDQIALLLSTSEEATKQAEEQSRALMENNRQMEEQQQQLQQQSEELQQTNAQMEEQQQQLRQQAEDARLKNMKLADSEKNLNKKAMQLEASNQYKSDFLANMSHELRTPLNSIILLSKILSRDTKQPLTEDKQKKVDVIHSAGKELQRLISDILDLSKIEAGKMELHLEQIDPSSFFQELHDLFESQTNEKNLKFKIQEDYQHSFVSDRNKLSQVLRNLLSNAIKFTAKGSVILSIKESNNQQLPIQIEVTDTGIGIPDDKKDLIFEAFQQVDGSISREFGGTGLGLSISLQFIQLMGGKITLTDTKNGGACFTLLLPNAEKRGDQVPTKIIAARPPSIPSKLVDDRDNLNADDIAIIVIEDNPSFAISLVEEIHSLDYKAIVAHNGKDGLEAIQQYQPNGILLDLGLPDMDGMEILEQLKSNIELSQIPVFILSGQDSKKEASMDRGAIGFLQKPMGPDDIGQALLEMLSTHTSHKQILIAEGASLKAKVIKSAFKGKNTEIQASTSFKKIETALKKSGGDLLILDYQQKDLDVIEYCHKAREICPEISLIIFSGIAISEEDQEKLRAYTDNIILDTPHSEKRLIGDIQDFLNNLSHLEEGLKKELVTMHEQHSEVLKGKNILVVDDDTRNLFVVTATLEQQSATVTTALNGKQAIKILKSNPVDLIFMDIMMPEMNGYEAIEKIRADLSLKQVPIIVLTAKALKEDKEKALKLGANDFLTKPLDHDNLITVATIWTKEQP